MLLLALIKCLCGIATFAAILFAATGLFHHQSNNHLGNSDLAITGNSDQGLAGNSRLAMAALLASYPLAFLVVFLDVAMAAAAGARIEGSRMGVGEGLRTAHRRADRIAVWTLAAIAVGFLLRLAATRLPDQLGIVTLPLDLLWVLVTIFVVPLLALEDAGLREVLRLSPSLLRRGWGEGLTGLIVIGIVAIIAVLPSCFFLLVGVTMMVLSGGGGLAAIGVGLLGLLVVWGLAGALQQVFAVSLYRYAAGASQ